MPSRLWAPAEWLRALVVTCVALCAIPAAAQAQTGTLWGSLALPGTAQHARSALSLGSASDRLDATLLLDFTRRWANLDLTAAAARFEQLITSSGGAVPEGQTDLPLPLPAFWQREFFVEDRSALVSLLRSRPALLTYCGLLGLDDDTLSWLDAAPELVRRIVGSDTAAAALATFGTSLRIADGRVITPGGPDAVPIWTALVGHEPRDVGPFVMALLTTDGGRLAWFYDTVAGLPSSHQRFALGLGADAPAGTLTARQVYDRFRGIEPGWRVQTRPFHRPPFDGGLVLATVDVDESGHIGPAWWTRLFEDVTRDSDWTAHTDVDQKSGPTGRADAAWLFSWVFERPEQASLRYAALRLLQRTFADTPLEAAAVLHDVIAATIEMPTLAASLERMGVDDPGIYSAVARAARRLTYAGPQGRVLPVLGRWQAGLGLLEQVQRARRLPPQIVAALLEDLTGRVPSTGLPPSGFIVEWIEKMAAEVSAASEDLFLEAATTPVDVERQVLEWEGLEYELTPGRAALASARAIRNGTTGPALEDLIEFDRIRRALAVSSGGHDARTLTGRLHVVAPVFTSLRDMAPDVVDDLGRALERAGADGERLDRARPAIDAAADLLTDAVLPALLYALAASPTSEPVLFANGWRGHALAIPSSPLLRDLPPWQALAWQFPTDYGLGGGSQLVGSWLGVDIALADARLVRLSDDTVPVPGLVDPRQRTALVETLTFGPLPGPDTVTQALAAGRVQVASWKATPPARADLGRRLRATGLDTWRANVIAWEVGRGRLDAFDALSITELFWIGGGASETFRSTSSRRIDGCFCRLPAGPVPMDRLIGRRLGIQAFRPLDVEIRLTEIVLDLGLDPALVPALLPMAVQDWLDRSQPGWFDDFDAFTAWPHVLSADRVETYLLHLLATGVLSPPRAEVQP